MTTVGQDSEGVLFAPRYSFGEADRIAGVSRGTSRRWLTGAGVTNAGEATRRRPPVTRRATDQDVSFIDLVEIVAVGRLRQDGFSLGFIRGAVDFCADELHIEHPLASGRFKHGGHDLFIDFHGELLDVGRRKRELAWATVLSPFLETLDYRDDIACQWWPGGRSQPVVVNPDYGFGLPVVKGSGVRTEIVFERFRAGDLAEQIATDFNLTTEDVQRAIQFESQRLAA